MGQNIVFEHVTPPPRHRPPSADPGGPGAFFTQDIALPAGTLAARFNVMVPPDLSEGTRVTIEIRGRGSADRGILTSGQWDIDEGSVALADHLVLAFRLEEPAVVGIRVASASRVAQHYLRAVKIQKVDGLRRLDWAGTHARHDLWPLDRIRWVMIGNSAAGPDVDLPRLAVPAPQPTAGGEVMSERIFEKLMCGLATCGLPVGGISFGLHGDPLVDRRLANRIRRLRAALPSVRVTVNTTGAAFSARQEEVVAAADAISVRVESLDPATYDLLMAPLRFADVIPRVEHLVEVAGTKAQLVHAVHRRNQHEIAGLEAWWARLGGGGVQHLPFTNRTAMTEAALGSHLAPVTGACTQDLAADLIVDWDGRILGCCSDIARRSDLGSLATAELADILADKRRQRFFRLLRNREWQQIERCRTCLYDDPAATAAAVVASRTAAQPAGGARA